ncbi:MAG: methylmalonyl-CoA mutase [Alphaproteobacteria bacterium]|jgi:methylmalonyl-CoA mutase, N-terminal domain|nr:methylmalonyl-CoA mutase [Alphaproteobacteria bacterium]MBT4082781.1 methylmalonyl-CoA mutase [Alphaproteobacteria bacterium]MBT4544010.1 methylmalonyl-CoA mutase [Alphaproteobacteria bacterium]MBT7745197.1 methylmalonyl-CoA mutase [Alphaproteobacteria bacterium]
MSNFEDANAAWLEGYRAGMSDEQVRKNRSGIDIKPLYGPEDWSQDRHLADLGFPGQSPSTRGIHATMHRGRPWSPRLVVGLGLPEDYNQRMRSLYDMGLTGLFVAPCNSHMRGFDPDEVEPELLGTCGTVISSAEDMRVCLEGLPVDKHSVSLGCTAPHSLSAFMFAVAKQRGIPWSQLTGTTNQSDYLSHFTALHMFFRIALPGQRRLMLDHIEWMNREAPRWNCLSVVGQHMQQAGATPAEAMGLTISSAIQFAYDLIERGHDPDTFLPRFSYFFDISISFFEEIAKFRAGRRVWDRITAERFGAKDPRSRRFRFHAQTSGVDLTRQQPLNNIARVAIQAMSGIFGGLQSLHTDSYDEALGSPTSAAAQIAVATQHILRDEAHLDDVIDPLGGSYYVENLTNEMEAKIEAVIQKIDDAGGMYRASETGVVQNMLGDSALDWQNKIDSGEQIAVGVNAHKLPDNPADRPPPQERLDKDRVESYLSNFATWKQDRSQGAVQKAIDDLARACNSDDENVYDRVVKAAMANVTHGEICATVRQELGNGEPLIVP